MRVSRSHRAEESGSWIVYRWRLPSVKDEGRWSYRLRAREFRMLHKLHRQLRPRWSMGHEDGIARVEIRCVVEGSGIDGHQLRCRFRRSVQQASTLHAEVAYRAMSASAFRTHPLDWTPGDERRPGNTQHGHPAASRSALAIPAMADGGEQGRSGRFVSGGTAKASTCDHDSSPRGPGKTAILHSISTARVCDIAPTSEEGP